MLQNDNIQDTIHHIVNQSPIYHPESPLPLTTASGASSPFPVEALGSVLRDAAEGICDIIQAPLAICAQSVLATATLAVQGHRDVLLPIGQKRPISEYFMSIAATGERKSSADTEALVPARAHEENLSAEYRTKERAWNIKYKAWKAEESQILHAKDQSSQAGALLEALGAAPERPMTPLVICTEPTFEGLCKHYTHGRPSIGIFSDEGGQFIGGHGMSKDEKLKTATALSNLWDGQPIKRIRAGDGTLILRGRRLAMHLMAQPDIASLLLCDPTLQAQGFLSRFLVTAPPSNIGTRFYREPQKKSREALEIYKMELRERFEKEFKLLKDSNGTELNELDVRYFTCSPEAIREWIGFSDHHERMMKEDEIFEPIRGMVNKAGEHAVRLAGILTLVQNMESHEISREAMEAAIELVKYYNNEALLLFQRGRNSKKMIIAQKLWLWIQTKWQKEYISLPDVYQKSIQEISTVAEALKAVSVLEEHDYLIRVEGGMKMGNDFRRDVWKIFNPQKELS